jgi:hypothetical protein
VAEHLRRGSDIPPIDLDGTLAAAERDITAQGPTEDDAGRGTFVLYRELAVAVDRLAQGDVSASRTQVGPA